MTYMIQGIDPTPFEHLFAADENQLAEALGMRVLASSDTACPCRVSLEDAKRGEKLLLVNHVSNDVAKPFRMAHAIYIREGAVRAKPVRDRMPEFLQRRTLGLRAFDTDGMMIAAILALPGEGDAKVRELFADETVSYIHAHNAAYGCFLAAIEGPDELPHARRF